MIEAKLKHKKVIMDGFKRLPYEVTDRVVRNATRKGAKILAEEFAQLAPVWSGRMRETAGVRRVTETHINGEVFYIGTGAFYIQFLEFGTDRIKARHDLLDAFDNRALEAVYVVEDDVLKRVERELKRSRFKVGKRRRR